MKFCLIYLETVSSGLAFGGVGMGWEQSGHVGTW